MPKPPFTPFGDAGPLRTHRRRLPHWDKAGCTYFVTFRLADSLPAGRLAALEHAREVWLREHPKPWSKVDWRAYDDLFDARMQHWLDQGHGSCLLRRSECRERLIEILFDQHKRQYALDSFVLMPNHVHALLRPDPSTLLAGIVQRWKTCSAQRINTFTGGAGRFWMPEYFDRAVRHEEGLFRYRRYIREDPAKARLKVGEYTFWSAG